MMDRSKPREKYWRSAVKPAAATAAVLICLIVAFLILVLTPHECGPKDGEILVVAPTVEVDPNTLLCPSGQGRNSDGVCTGCPPGSVNDGITSRCKLCPIGTFANETGLSRCYPCLYGLTTPATGFASSDCVCKRDMSPFALPSGTCQAECLCRETPAGRQPVLDNYCSDGSDRSNCMCTLSAPTEQCVGAGIRDPVTDPPSGFQGFTEAQCIGEQEKGCVMCPANSYKDVPSWGECLPCTDKRIPSRTFVESTCICSPGYYRDEVGCPPCPVGTYKRKASDEGNTTCIVCPKGTTTRSHASIGLGDCQCDVGFEGYYTPRQDGSLQLELQCRACQQGFQKGDVGPHECEPCAPGTHALQNETVQCEVCSKGKIASGIGSVSCTDCLPGSYSALPGSVECKLCVENTFNFKYGASECTQCSKNTFAAEGSVICSDCWQNYMADSGMFLSKKGDIKLGWSIIPTIFLLIVILSFFFFVFLCYEAARYLLHKRAPDEFDDEEGVVEQAAYNEITQGNPELQQHVNPVPQAAGLQTLMAMSQEQLYRVQKAEQEELTLDQERIKANLRSVQGEALEQLRQQPTATVEQQQELRLQHQTQVQQLEAYQSLQLRGLQERHLKEQEAQMKSQQEQLDQQYQLQQQEWQNYQREQYLQQAREWEAFQKQMHMQKQQQNVTMDWSTQQSQPMMQPQQIIQQQQMQQQQIMQQQQPQMQPQIQPQMQTMQAQPMMQQQQASPPPPPPPQQQQQQQQQPQQDTDPGLSNEDWAVILRHADDM